jgi:hypothetical protein
MFVIATAIAGKFGGSSLAAWMAGVPGRDAAALGILMNTRVSQQVFAMMVLMALVTAFVT